MKIISKFIKVYVYVYKFTVVLFGRVETIRQREVKKWKYDVTGWNDVVSNDSHYIHQIFFSFEVFLFINSISFPRDELLEKDLSLWLTCSSRMSPASWCLPWWPGKGRRGCTAARSPPAWWTECWADWRTRRGRPRPAPSCRWCSPWWSGRASPLLGCSLLP